MPYIIEIILKYYYSLNFTPLLIEYNKKSSYIVKHLDILKSNIFIRPFSSPDINKIWQIDIYKNFSVFNNSILLKFNWSNCFIYDGKYLIKLIGLNFISTGTCIIPLGSSYKGIEIYTYLINKKLIDHDDSVSDRLNNYLYNLYNSEYKIYDDRYLYEIGTNQYKNCPLNFELDLI